MVLFFFQVAGNGKVENYLSYINVYKEWDAVVCENELGIDSIDINDYENADINYCCHACRQADILKYYLIGCCCIWHSNVYALVWIVR